MLSVRLRPDLEARLNDIAKKTHRSKTYYVEQALEEYLEDMEDYITALAVSERIKSGKERTYTLEEMKKKYGLDDA